MTLKALFTSLFCSLFTFFSFGQLSAVHSSLSDTSLCSSQDGTITFTLTSGNFAPSDSILVILPNTAEVSSSAISFPSGSFSQTNDTLVLFGLPSTSSVDLNYTLFIDCEAFDINTYSLSVPYSFTLNSGSWIAQSTNSINISSPVLNFIGGNQLNFNNAFLGQGVVRDFYFTNTSSSAPFNGTVQFCDTLPHSLSSSAIILDSVYLNSAVGTVLSSQINDSIVEITIDINDLQQGDTLVISDIAYLHDCVVLQNNQTRFKMNYGCSENDLCQAVVNNNNTFNTSLNFDPNDKPIATAINFDVHHEACYSDTVIRTDSIVNTGLGQASGFIVTFQDEWNEYGITFLDTSLIEVYLNSISAGNLLSFTTSLYQPSVNQFYYTITSNAVISSMDTLIIVYREVNKCIDKVEYDTYFNNTIKMHDIRVVTKFLHPCQTTGFAATGANSYYHHTYSINQQFNNLIGTIGDLESKWFEIENLSGFQIGNFTTGGNTQGIAYDINNSQIEIDIILESGLSVTNTDSVVFCSTFNGTTTFLTNESTTIHYGLPGVNQFDTVRTVFSLPSNFQTTNTNPGFHNDFLKTSDFDEFFANSSIKFKATAFCDSVAADSKAKIRENFYFKIDSSCIDCKLPLGSVQDTVNILCPGCVLPGWNLTEFEIERTNLGYIDSNNDHFPDSFPLQSLSQSSNPQNKRAMIGDTLKFRIEGFITDGDPTLGVGFSFNTLGITFDEGQFLFKGDVGKLQFIGGTGMFTEGLNSTSFNVPSSAATEYPTAIGIDMSIDSLNSYGVTGITNYNDSCSIVFYPKFRVVSNFDDGAGVNPYISLKNITAFYFMGGTPFGAPDILEDANIQTIGAIDSMSIGERDSLSYWCVGYDGRFIGIGADHTFYSPHFLKSGTVENNDCKYRMGERFLGIVGDNALIGAGSNSTDPNGTLSVSSSQAFSYELRDLYNLDSITFHYPSQLEVYEILINSHAYKLNTSTYNSQWSTTDIIPSSPSLYTSTPTSITIYPELFQHTNTSYTSGDNHGTYDENIHYQPIILLRNTVCTDVDTVALTNPYIDNYFSNFPGATNGDTIISLQMVSNGHSQGVGPTGYLDFPNPTFTVSATSVTPQSGSNVGLQIDYGVVTPLPYSNSTHLQSRTNDVAYHSFMAFASPNGNFNNLIVPTVHTTSTNYSTLNSTTTSAPPAFVNTVSGHLLIGTQTLGGDSYHYGYSKKIDLYASHDCSSVSSGGIDSLYLIYGWNCFDYPDTLENACFIDTFVLYITMPNTGLNVDYSIQDSLSLCDTMNFTATFDPTGFGEVSDVTIEVLNPANSGINYLANSAYLNYDVSNTQVEPTTSINSYEWLLDSTNAGLYNFDELSPSATFTADFVHSCGITDDTVFILMSGTNYCGQIIYQDTFEITPQVYYDLPNLDALSVVASVDPFLSCSDTNTVSVSVNNIGGSASNTYNQLQIVLPSGYDYVTGGSPSYNSNDTLIFDLSTSIATSGTFVLPFDVVKTDSSCEKQFISAQVLLNSPYYCDTNQCFYSSATSSLNIAILQVDPGGLMLGTIDPTSLCSGMNEITLNFSSLGSGALEVFDANTNTSLGQGNYSNSNGSVSQITIALSDTTSSLFVVNSSPCCPDTTYYTFDCDTICFVNADFSIQDTICSSDSLTCIVPMVNDTSYSHHWIFEEGGFSFHNYTSSPCYNFGNDGTVTITHIVSAPCGSDTVTQTVSVIHFDNSISINLIGQNPLCLGDSLLLTPSSPVISIEWYDENGVFVSNQDSLYVYSAGVYSATITDSNGCERIIPTTVFETPQPIVAASGNSTICSGDSVLINASGANNYQWDNGLGTVSSAYVSPSITTTYTVIGTSSGCSSSDQVTITVLPVDSVSQSYSICSGDTVSVGSNNYTSNGTYIDTLVAVNGCDSIVSTSITVLADSSTVDSLHFCQGEAAFVNGTFYYQSAIDTLTLQTSNGCDYTITTVITFHPADSVTQDTTICEGFNIAVLGNVYDSTGTYIDITQNIYGCDSTIITNLTVLDAPIVSINPVDTLCIDISGPVTLVTDPSGGTLSGAGISGTTFYPDSAGVGSHTITYTYIDNDTGCEGTTTIVIVVEKCAGIENHQLQGVTLHPNPNKGKFMISGLSIGTDYEIVDSRGRIVKSGVTQTENEEIDLYGVETGVYYLYATKNGVRGNINFVILK